MTIVYNQEMIIFDSSTLILLAKIYLLDIFVLNFNAAVLMPEKVAAEVRDKNFEESPLISKLIKDEKIKILKIKKRKLTIKLMSDFNIDEGEAEAISLALQEKINIIATDDRNAIRACKVLKIEFITAISVLLRAHEKGLIDKDIALVKLQKLASIGRYSKSIIADAEKHLRGGV